MLESHRVKLKMQKHHLDFEYVSLLRLSGDIYCRIPFITGMDFC